MTLVEYRIFFEEKRQQEGAIMGIAMIAGTYVTKRFISNMNKDKFQKYAAVLLCVVGLYMVVIGG